MKKLTPYKKRIARAFVAQGKPDVDAIQLVKDYRGILDSYLAVLYAKTYLGISMTDWKMMGFPQAFFLINEKLGAEYQIPDSFFQQSEQELNRAFIEMIDFQLYQEEGVHSLSKELLWSPLQDLIPDDELRNSELQNLYANNQERELSCLLNYYKQSPPPDLTPQDFYKSLLISTLLTYKPQKTEQADVLLLNYADREPFLFRSLEKKFASTGTSGGKLVREWSRTRQQLEKKHSSASKPAALAGTPGDDTVENPLLTPVAVKSGGLPGDTTVFASFAAVIFVLFMTVVYSNYQYKMSPPPVVTAKKPAPSNSPTADDLREIQRTIEEALKSNSNELESRYAEKITRLESLIEQLESRDSGLYQLLEQTAFIQDTTSSDSIRNMTTDELLEMSSRTMNMLAELENTIEPDIDTLAAESVAETPPVTPEPTNDSEFSTKGSNQEPTIDANRIHLVGGSFLSKINALRKMEQLREKGVDATYLGQFDKYHLVAVGSFDSMEEATSMLETYKKQGVSARIME